MPLVSGRYPPKNPFWLVDGQPTGTQRFNLADGRFDGTVDLSALTTQIMLAVAMPLQAGDIVTNLTFISGGTGAGTPTNWWFALYNNAATPALLAQTADQASAAWAANTVMTVALQTPQRILVPDVYYCAIMVKATTPPTLVGRAAQHAVVSGAVLAGQKILAQTSGSALTTTAPATIASPTTVANIPLCYVS